MVSPCMVRYHLDISNVKIYR